LTKVFSAAVALSLLSVGAFAQEALRSASLPERPLPPLPSERPDLFRAAPDTYVPHPVQQPTLNPGFVVSGFPYAWSSHDDRRQRHDRDSMASERPQPERPAVVPPIVPPEKYVAGVPGKPKTFYVIPGCYAGDRRPEPDLLPPGCDASKLKTVPPRAI
jgi:hypothetical protein